MTQPLPGQLPFDLDGHTEALQAPTIAPDVKYSGPAAANAPTASHAALQGLWLAFTPETPAPAICAAFRRKYGADPATIRPGLGGLILAGPVTASGRGQR
jgi:hypothetical protein